MNNVVRIKNWPSDIQTFLHIVGCALTASRTSMISDYLDDVEMAQQAIASAIAADPPFDVNNVTTNWSSSATGQEARWLGDTTCQYYLPQGGRRKWPWELLPVGHKYAFYPAEEPIDINLYQFPLHKNLLLAAMLDHFQKDRIVYDNAVAFDYEYNGRQYNTFGVYREWLENWANKVFPPGSLLLRHSRFRSYDIGKLSRIELTEGGTKAIWQSMSSDECPIMSCNILQPSDEIFGFLYVSFGGLT